MLVELHCHTKEHSACSHVPAADLVQHAFEKGVGGIVLTDHDYLWSAEEIDDLRSKLSVPDDFMITSGQEVTSDIGHVLVFGQSTPVPRGTPLSCIRQSYPEAALVWAHPYRDRKVPTPEQLLNPLLDAIEIFTSNHTVSELYRALQDWHLHKFIATGGTDTHAADYAAVYPTLFDHPVKNAGELSAEIRNGRCRPYFREVRREGTSDTRITELIIGTKGKDLDEGIIVKSYESPDSWRSSERTFRIMEEIAGHGFTTGRFRVPRPFESEKEHLRSLEQGIPGKTLFDKLLKADVENSRYYIELTARWLARLHNLGLQITPPQEFLETEPKRLQKYVSILLEIHHKHARRVEEIKKTVVNTERHLFGNHLGKMVQGHGDFHPKNILIGQDDPDDRETCFVAAVDFASSHSMPPSFDVGTFLAQYRNQFFNEREVLAKVSEETFLQAYMREAQSVGRDFLFEVELFKARTNLSIIYFLVKIGLGESENLWRVLVEAEKCLTYLGFRPDFLSSLTPSP